MDSEYLVSRVKTLAQHADMAQRFAWCWGSALDALLKATDGAKNGESIEVSFNENKPGEFEIYERLKGRGFDGFDDLKRLARGNVHYKRNIIFNSQVKVPECLISFFWNDEWDISTAPIEIEVR